MTRPVCLGASLLLASAAAVAVLASPAPSSILEAAFHDSEERAGDGGRWAFTVTVRTGEVTVVARFDPSQPEGRRWQALAPSVEEMDDDALQTFEELSQSEDADLEIVLDGARARALVCENPAVVARSDREIVVRSAVSPDAVGGDAFAENLVGETRVRTDSPRIVGHRLIALKPFKPNPMVKLITFEVEMEVGEVFAGGPLAVVSSREEVAGRAFLQAYRKTKVKTYSDFSRAPS